MFSSQAIIASNISCVRGDNTLFKKLNVTVSGAQCLHVTGPNGCGKTSLLRIIAGLSTADTGTIAWNEQTIGDCLNYFKSCAYIGHKDGLKNEFTAVENLRYYQQLNSPVNEDNLDDALEKMGLLSRADIPAQKLSFGQRRRLAFARLLINEFAVWILDEPFTGIDSDGRKVIEALCVEHLNNNGLIVMTHHQSLNDSPLNKYRTELALSV